ncbi:MAG: hypothetical protein IKB98_01190 [Clostridia bacterium]|nr:hypothetical protein [Clostridia bacterium]
MNKDNLKSLLYKIFPIALVSLIALNIVFFFFGYVGIAEENVNIATIFSHLGNISNHHTWSNAANVSLFISSIAFIGVLIGLIVVAVFSALTLRLCILTKTTDFKQEYIVKLRNYLILSLFITACYIGLVAFLLEASFSATAIILFILALIVITGLKVAGFYFENLPLSDFITKSCKALLLNVIYLVLGATLLIPCIDMMINGYNMVSYLLPSESVYGAFYSTGLIFNLLVGVICLLAFGCTLALFFMNTRNDHVDGPVNRRIVKSSFILFLILTIAFAIVTLLCIISGLSALKLTFGQVLNNIRVTLLPALLLSVSGLVFFAIDFKIIRDSE